jgi:hypothetical protein
MVAVQRPPTLALTLREFDRPRAMARKAFKSIPDLTQPAGALFPDAPRCVSFFRHPGRER